MNKILTTHWKKFLILALCIAAGWLLFTTVFTDSEPQTPTPKTPTEAQEPDPKVVKGFGSEVPEGPSEEPITPEVSPTNIPKPNSGTIVSTPNVSVTVPTGYHGRKADSDNGLSFINQKSTKILVNVTPSQASLQSLLSGFLQPVASSSDTISEENFSIANKPAKLLTYTFSNSETARVIAIGKANNKAIFVIAEGNLAARNSLVAEVRKMAEIIQVK